MADMVRVHDRGGHMNHASSQPQAGAAQGHPAARLQQLRAEASAVLHALFGGGAGGQGLAASGAAVMAADGGAAATQQQQQQQLQRAQQARPGTHSYVPPSSQQQRRQRQQQRQQGWLGGRVVPPSGDATSAGGLRVLDGDALPSSSPSSSGGASAGAHHQDVAFRSAFPSLGPASVRKTAAIEGCHARQLTKGLSVSDLDPSIAAVVSGRPCGRPWWCGAPRRGG
jgi:hypothetical protein